MTTDFTVPDRDSLYRPDIQIFQIFLKAAKDKKRAKEAKKAGKGPNDGDGKDDDDESDGEEVQMSETNGNLCFLKGNISPIV